MLEERLVGSNFFFPDLSVGLGCWEWNIGSNSPSTGSSRTRFLLQKDTLSLEKLTLRKITWCNDCVTFFITSFNFRLCVLTSAIYSVSHEHLYKMSCNLNNHNLTEHNQNHNIIESGIFKNPWLEGCVPLMRERGVGLVRRRSGGGSVYHVSVRWPPSEPVTSYPKNMLMNDG